MATMTSSRRASRGLSQRMSQGQETKPWQVSGRMAGEQYASPSHRRTTFKIRKLGSDLSAISPAPGRGTHEHPAESGTRLVVALAEGLGAANSNSGSIRSASMPMPLVARGSGRSVSVRGHAWRSRGRRRTSRRLRWGLVAEDDVLLETRIAERAGASVKEVREVFAGYGVPLITSPARPRTLRLRRLRIRAGLTSNQTVTSLVAVRSVPRRNAKGSQWVSAAGARSRFTRSRCWRAGVSTR